MQNLTHPGSQYTDEDRRRAAIEYAILGSLVAVEKSTGIPDSTLCEWKKQEWWEDLIGQARTEIEDKFRGKCHQIVEESTTAILDRIEHGNEVNTKDGIQRMRVPAGELAKVGGIFYDKLRLSLNLPTSISEGSGYKKAMDNLANEFRRLSATYKARDANVVSVQSGESELENSTE
jgi:hypothetical protein